MLLPIRHIIDGWHGNVNILYFTYTLTAIYMVFILRIFRFITYGILVNAFHCRLWLWIADTFTCYTVQTAIICVSGYKQQFPLHLNALLIPRNICFPDDQVQKLMSGILTSLPPGLQIFVKGVRCQAFAPAPVRNDLYRTPGNGAFHGDRKSTRLNSSHP